MDDKRLTLMGADELRVFQEKARAIRVIAMDLDGTLHDSKHEVRDETQRVLKQLADSGMILVAATGRARTTIPEAVVALEGMKYLISANGAKIYIAGTNELIFEKYIDPKAIDYILPFFDDPEVMCEIFWDGTPHVEETKYNNARDYGIPKWFSDYFFNTRHALKDFKAAVFENAHHIENVNFVFGREDVQDRVYDFLKPRQDLYELTSSFPFNYEIGGLGVSKGAALEFLAQRDSIKPEEVISFGDQDNDVTMIEYAGIGVATSNASDKALAAADLLTLDNDSEGVAYALKLLFQL